MHSRTVAAILALPLLLAVMLPASTQAQPHLRIPAQPRHGLSLASDTQRKPVNAAAALPRARVSATAQTLTSGRLLVTVTSNAKKVRVSWRTAAGAARKATVKVRSGRATIKLAKGSRGISARALATKGMRASVRVAVGATSAPQPSPAPDTSGSPAPVTGLTIPTAGATSVTLAWTNPAAPGSIVVRRSVGLAPPATTGSGVGVLVDPATTSTVTDKGLSPNTDYAYSVFHVSPDGRASVPSAVGTRTDPDAGGASSPAPTVLADSVVQAQPGFAGLPGSKLPVGVAPEASYYSIPASCDPTEKLGVRKFYDLFHAAYPVGRFGGITRLCALGAEGEHKEGRALDWMLDSSNADQRLAGDNISGWLAADQGRNARALGIEYLIWRGMMWRSYADGAGPQYRWTEYAGCLGVSKRTAAYATSCHRDHIHISFSWDGAYARTSFWTGKVLADNDFGQCRALSGESAALPDGSRANVTPCPEPAAKRWWNAGVAGSKLVLGSAGATEFKQLLDRATGQPATAGDTFDKATRDQVAAGRLVTVSSVPVPPI